MLRSGRHDRNDPRSARPDPCHVPRSGTPRPGSARGRRGSPHACCRRHVPGPPRPPLVPRGARRPAPGGPSGLVDGQGARLVDQHARPVDPARRRSLARQHPDRARLRRRGHRRGRQRGHRASRHRRCRRGRRRRDPRPGAGAALRAAQRRRSPSTRRCRPATWSPKPAWLSFDEAACLPVAWGTAYRMLFTQARIRPGDRVLVQGAGGGVASAAIRLAVAAGAVVYATSRSAESAPRPWPGVPQRRRDRRTAPRAGGRGDRDGRRGDLGRTR